MLYLKKDETPDFKRSFQYSVVTAVYNAEKYLETYFTSITGQSIDFEKFIQLIIVDDGSTDRSTEIIKCWQQQYPHNILYFKKTNGGPASARNLGLDYASGDWVTFTDADDFLERSYFQTVHNFIAENRQVRLGLIACRPIIYREDVGEYVDSHPLRYRFKKDAQLLPANDLKKFMQFQVTNAFLKLEYIQSINLKMDERVRPVFEDGHFVARYLLRHQDITIGVLPQAIHYYRKRADNTSVLDTKHMHAGYYDDVLRFGYISLLNEAKDRCGFVPTWLQRMILYDLVWRIKEAVNKPQVIAHLTEREKKEYLQHMQKAVSYIDKKTITSFSQAKFTHKYKTGFLGVFKQHLGIYRGIRVLTVDSKRKLLKLRYFYHGEQPREEFMIAGQKVLPAFTKNIRYELMESCFSTERIVWIPFAAFKNKNKIIVRIDDVRVRLTARKLKREKALSLKEIKSQFKPTVVRADIPSKDRLIRRLARSKMAQRYFHNAWIFIDRDTQADDNAEHLYRFVQKKYPQTNAFFLLRKSSHDWLRLKREGFRLIPYDSLQHKLALLNARHLISSVFDRYVLAYLDEEYYRDRLKYDYTFLQHGVTKHNLSGMLNKIPIDLFVTAGKREYDSLVGENFPYTFCEKEVVLTGFPRHDSLLNNVRSEKVLLIMPTWRRTLAGRFLTNTSTRLSNPAFFSSQFAYTWKSFLHSPKLKKIVERYGYKIIFSPHGNLQPYIEYFAVPQYIEVVLHNANCSIQELFQRAGCLLTDYSSVAFEMAYLKKLVVYYQFDFDYVFSGGHLGKGYFDYERDGFGPVCYDEHSLMDELSNILERDCEVDDRYISRMERTFAFHDGNCCERTFRAILALEQQT